MHHNPWNSAAATAAAMPHATTSVTAVTAAAMTHGATAAVHHYADHTASAHHHASAAPAPPTSPSDGPYVSADEVGAAFAFQYFKIMKTRPDDLFRFYNNDSKISRGAPGTNGTIDVRHAAGPSRIRDLLYKEHFCGIQLALAIINNIEAQDSAAGAVIVQITGTLKFVDETAREFVMSAYLVQQDSTSVSGYYVLNDIFIFQQQQQQIDNNGVSARQLPGDKPQQRRISKPNFGQPQQTRLSQEPLDPINPPVAPSAQPAAAPLPTTTAPQLSGATNTPIAVTATLKIDQSCFASPASPTLSSRRTDTAALVEDLRGDDEDEEVLEGSSLNGEGTTPQSLSVQIKDDVEEKQFEEEVPESPVEIAKGQMVEPPATAASKEKKSVWKKPVSSVATPDGFGEIASTTPTEIPKQPTSHQISGKSTNAAASPSFSSSSSSKPFKPVDASRYSETSYAAKLLRPGPGGLRAPCQAGFAVPPASDPKPGVTVDERRGDRKQPQSYRNRPGRGKTLWISLIPAEMSDEKVSQAISDQLRGQSCEGHVVRIERIPNQQHGYIELDTEICAKLLREKGLHLQGRVVMLDFPNRNLNVRRTPPRNEDVSADVSRLQQQQRRLFSNRREAGPAHSNGHSANGNIVSSQNSQESEEGWTSATRRRPQQQQQGQQRYVNNRRRMSDSNINKNKNNNKTSLPQQMGRQFGHPPPQQKNTQT